MTWARIDDGFPNHPKVVAAGPICELIQIRAICYCCRYLTDGFVPMNAVAGLLTGFENVGLMGGGVDGLFQIGYDFSEIDWPAKMVDTGLWHPHKDGYLVHDFLKYNPSKKDVERERKRKSQGGKEGAKRRWRKDKEAVADPMGGPMSTPKAHPSGIPMLPYPYPLNTKSSTPGSTTRSRSTTPRATEPGASEIAHAMDRIGNSAGAARILANATGITLEEAERKVAEARERQAEENKRAKGRSA